MNSIDTLIGDCERCPLSNTFLVSGYGPTGGLCLVGEAPGQNEVRLKKPFSGISGRLIRQILTECQVNPDSVRWTNAALCRPPRNKTPTISAIAACNQRLFKELELANPTKIFALGSSALTALMGAHKPMHITKWRGKGFYTNVGDRKVYTVGTYHPSAVLRDADLFRDAVTDLQKLLSQEGPYALPKVEAWIPTTEMECLSYLDEIRQMADALTCDLETTGFDPDVDDIISVGFGHCRDDNSGEAVIVGGNLINIPSVKSKITELLSEQMCYHNAKFDLKFIEKWLGTTFSDNVDDTMLMNYTMDERPMGQFSTHSLKTLARIHFDADDYSWDWNKFFADPEKFKIIDLYKYQALDCYYTARLRKVKLEEMDEEAYHLYTNILCPGMNALRAVERVGVPIDVSYLKEMETTLTTEIRQSLKTLQDQIEALTGVQGFNPNSPQQVMSALTMMGIPLQATGKDELNAIISRVGQEEGSIIRRLLSFRNDSKLLQTYVHGFLSRASSDGRIYGDFLLHGTVTGRLASRNPNLQNIPHHGGGGEDAGRRGDTIRRAFIADPGYTFIEADYSQLELRVAAYYSNDRLMRQTFVDGIDIHYQVAVQMFGKLMEEISSQERHLAKYFDFGLVYGRSAKSLAEGREMDIIAEQGGHRWTLRDAENFMKRFLQGFPDLALWLRKQRETAHTHHEVSTPTGRRRRFDLVLPDGLAERQAINAPIQGLSSDICLTALTRLQKELDPEVAKIFFTVHDSIGGEIRTDKLDEYVHYFKEIMEDVTIIDTDIPFKVEIKAGPNWTDTKVIE